MIFEDFEDRTGRRMRVRLLVRYAPLLLGLDNLEGLLQNPDLHDPSLWHPDLPRLICGLRVASHLAFSLAPNRVTALSVGYIVTDERNIAATWDAVGPEFSSRLASRFPAFADYLPRDSRHLLSLLREMEGETHPLFPGPVCTKTEGQHIVFDLASAGARVLQVMRYTTKTGRPGSVRGTAFEEAVQRAIDKTRWAPPTEIRALARRPLRRDGKVLSDIDAIAHRSGVTLLIACRSVLYTPEYDAGDRRTVRNVEARIQDAVDKNDELIRELLTNPVGDNFDVRAWGQLVAVVVTPHVMFVELSLAERQAIPGLRTYSSLHELVTWLTEE